MQYSNENTTYMYVNIYLVFSVGKFVKTLSINNATPLECVETKHNANYKSQINHRNSVIAAL